MSNKYFKSIEYKLVDKKIAYQGKRLRVEELKYLNGTQEIYREHVIAGEAAVILAIKDNGNVIMIQEPRTPINKVVLALPARSNRKGWKCRRRSKKRVRRRNRILCKKNNKIKRILSFCSDIQMKK